MTEEQKKFIDELNAEIAEMSAEEAYVYLTQKIGLPFVG